MECCHFLMRRKRLVFANLKKFRQRTFLIICWLKRKLTNFKPNKVLLFKNTSHKFDTGCICKQYLLKSIEIKQASRLVEEKNIFYSINFLNKIFFLQRDEKKFYPNFKNSDKNKNSGRETFG